MEEKITRFFVTALAVAAILSSIVHVSGQQPPPDPAFMQRAIAALQTQRNAALDQAAALEAKVNMLTEEAAALKKQIEDMKPKSAEPAK